MMIIAIFASERHWTKTANPSCSWKHTAMADCDRLAIVRANRYVVDHVDYLIAYVWHSASNASELAEYAQKRERKGLITVTML